MLYNANVQDRFLSLLRREIGHTGSNPDDFFLTRSIAHDDLGDTYRVTCKNCMTFQAQVMCDWSENYKVDNLIEMVIDFTKSHRHSEPVVLDAEQLPSRMFLDV